MTPLENDNSSPRTIASSIDGLQESLQKNRDVLTAYCDIVDKNGLDNKVRAGNGEILEDPATLDALLVVLLDIKEAHPDTWSTYIPEYTDKKQFKLRIYKAYLTQLEAKKQKNILSPMQSNRYDTEKEQIGKSLVNIQEWATYRTWGIAEVFMPMRYRELKLKEGAQRYSTLRTSVWFIPKKTNLLMDTLQDQSVRIFVEKNKTKLDQIRPIIQHINITDKSTQTNIVAYLLLCNIDTDFSQKLIEASKEDDHYNFVKQILTQAKQRLQRLWSTNNAALSNLKGIEFALDRIEKLHQRAEQVESSRITLPNVILLPEGFAGFSLFVDKNPDLKAFDLIVQTK